MKANPAYALDAEMTLRLHFRVHWRGAAQTERSI